MEKIDILMATYNGEKYVREQIDSILSQTYTNFNLIISDDCSTDNTVSILKEYEKKDNRITVYVQEKNLGYIKNFEFLLKQVKSEYFMLSDQDDVWLSQKVEKTYQKMIEDDVDLVFGDLFIVNEKLEIINDSMFKFLKVDKRLKKYHDYKLIYMDNCVTGCTLMSKRKFLPLILPLPSSTKYLVHDYWIALVVILNGKFSYMEEKYIKYRQHTQNQIGTDKISTKFEKFDMVRDLFVTVKKERFSEFVKNEKVFDEKLRKLNIEALNYYTNIEGKRYFNFRGLSTFHKLYKYQTFFNYMLFFVIMNLPILGRLIFNIRYLVLKVIGKR